MIAVVLGPTPIVQTWRLLKLFPSSPYGELLSAQCQPPASAGKPVAGTQLDCQLVINDRGIQTDPGFLDVHTAMGQDARAFSKFDQRIDPFSGGRAPVKVVRPEDALKPAALIVAAFSFIIVYQLFLA